MGTSPTKALKQDAALTAIMAATMAFLGDLAQAQTFPPENPPCPTSRVTQPQGGLAPFPAHCKTPNCLVNFKGYQWWTSYQVPFFNGGLHTPFAPEHTSVDGDGNMHLLAADDIDLGAGKVWAGGEAVLMFNGDGSEANLGYGDYLVTARLINNFWSGLDPNMAFGLFTYENPGTGPNSNPNREMDLAEISRWGWNHTGTCPIGGFNFNFPNKTLCQGDAQFALQKIDNAQSNGGPSATQGPLMVDRYNIGDNSMVTLVMRWRENAVTFEKYTGNLNASPPTLNKLPGAPHDKWQDDLTMHPTPPDFKTDPPKEPKANDLTNFITVHAANSCERFHMNFWFGNYSAGMNPNPHPASRQEVVITNFEFSPPK